MSMQPAPPGARAVSRVEKPWGHELVWAETDRYLGKVLHIRAGERLSLHLHRFKDETLYVLSGDVTLTVREGLRLQEYDLGPTESYRIPPHTLHRLTARTDCQVLEVSTPHLDDAVRLEDDYGRAEPLYRPRPPVFFPEAPGPSHPGTG